MNPRVGDTLRMSSPIMLFTIDVLPLLSSPLHYFSWESLLLPPHALVVQHKNPHFFVLQSRLS